MNPGASPWPTTPRSRSDSPTRGTLPRSPKALPPWSLCPSPSRSGGRPGPPGRSGSAALSAGGFVPGWGGSAAVSGRLVCSALPSPRDITRRPRHGRGRAAKRGRPQSAHAGTDARPTEATAKPGRRRAARKGGPKAHTAEQGQDPGGDPGEAIWRQGRGPRPRHERAPKRTSRRGLGLSTPPAVPRHDGPRRQGQGAGPPPRRRGPTGNGREGQRDEGGMALGEGGKRREGMELSEHGRRVCRVELAPGAGWALEVWL